MKAIVVKKYTCPNCDDELKIRKADTYVRCSCGTLALYGNPQDPVVVCGTAMETPTSVDILMPVPDDYTYRRPWKGGIIIANPRRGAMTGMTKEQMDMIMPLLAFAKMMGWDSNKLIAALKAFADYDELISKNI